MQSSTLIKTITILGALTVANFCGILSVDYYMSQPQSSYSIDTLGAIFKAPEEPNVINVDLVRPPRRAVNPGDNTSYEGVITNTSNNPIHCRSTYQIVIHDKDGVAIKDMATNVVIDINDNWYLEDGYWYYKKPILVNEEAPTLIDNIFYSESFAEHLDYKVYIYVLTEAAEEKDGKIAKWPNKDIDTLHEKANSKSESWTTVVNIM